MRVFYFLVNLKQNAQKEYFINVSVGRWMTYERIAFISEGNLYPNVALLKK